MNLRQCRTVEEALQVASHRHTRVCFSQFGEDIIVESLLQALGRDKAPGFYVDVGAFDPVFISNTHMLHLRGWSGVNIDANPAAIDRFRRARPNDRNIHAAVSEHETDVEFDVYALDALSTANPATKAAYARDGRSHVTQTLHLKTRTLRSILAEAVPAEQSVDLMSVDAEGMDLDVLKSNDWNRFAPLLLLVEDQALSLLNPPKSQIFDFLRPLGYRLAAQAYITSVYLRDQRIQP